MADKNRGQRGKRTRQNDDRQENNYDKKKAGRRTRELKIAGIRAIFRHEKRPKQRRFSYWRAHRETAGVSGWECRDRNGDRVNPCSRDNACRLSRLCKFKILVVFGITTIGNGYGDPHNMGLAKQRHQETNAFVLANVFFKPRPAQDIFQFIDNWLGQTKPLASKT